MARGPSRRQLILDTARAAFAERGYDGTSVGEIAGSIGVSKSAVSFHFPSKEDLLVALVEPFFAEMDELFDPQPSPSWPDGVLELAGDYFDVLIRHHDIAVWIDADRSVQVRYETQVSALFSRMADAITGPDPDPAAHVRALAAVGGLWRPLRLLDDAALGEHRSELLEAALVSYAPL